MPLAEKSRIWKVNGELLPSSEELDAIDYKAIYALSNECDDKVEAFYIQLFYLTNRIKASEQLISEVNQDQEILEKMTRMNLC